MMKKVSFILFVLVLFSGYQLFGQEIVSQLMSKSWEGKGQLMGNEAQFEMQWTFALDGQFLHLKFKNEMALQNNSIVTFKANAYYKLNADNSIEGMWFDSRGMYFPLKGLLSKNEISIIWGSAETEQGKTIYTLTEENSINVKDFVLKEGEYINFGNAKYN